MLLLLDMAESKGSDILNTHAYSPKMNPIENFFGTIKTEYRKLWPFSGDVYKAVFGNIINEFKDRCLYHFFVIQ